MARTIDDIYDRLTNLLDAINNSYSRGHSGGPNSNVDDVINDFRKQLGDLSDNLDKYNTTFEKDIIANQEKNAKELDKLQKEYLERFEKFKEKNSALYEKYNKQIEDAIEVLKDDKSTASQKSQARKDIEDAQKHIDRKNRQFEEQKTTKRQKEKINDTKRLIAEDQEDKRRFRNSRVGQNISKFEDTVGNTRMYGKQMQSLGKAVGGKFGGAISKAGGGLTKFAGALGKAVPVIGWVITALQLLGDAAKAVAEADAELQEIQNERNTARTNRNIERSKIDTQSLVDELQTATAKGLASFQTESNYAIGQQNVGNMKSIAAAQVSTNAITNGYNDAAWDALNHMLDINAAQSKVNLSYEAESQKTERANALKELEFQGRQSVREVDKRLVDQDLREKETELDKRDRNYTREHPFATTLNRAVGSSTNSDKIFNPGGQSYGTVESANKTSIETAVTMGTIESIPLVGGLVSPFTDAAYTKQDTLAKQKLVNERNTLNSQKALAENVSELSVTMKTSTNELADSYTDAAKTIAEAAIDTQNTIDKTYAQFARTIENWTLNFEKIALDSAASKGLTTNNQNGSYSKFMNQTTRTLSKWGLNEQDVIQMQNAYGQGTGRSIIGDETSMNKTAAFGKYLGDNNLAVELSNSTEIFNMGMSTTMDLMWDMTKKVNKMGLDGRKYMKDMTQNLKMAQKYNFKNGVQGMMNMAKWAQSVRYDMNKLPALLEDILGGGLEGIIEKGAKLQVLGGGFAMGADPLAMMYEAMEDPDSLAKRINAMTEGMGKFDSKTGQVKFNGMEQRQLQLLAQYTGQSLDDVKNQASYKIKNEKMGHLISNDLDEEQRASLVNKAYYKDGQWMVNGIDGKPMQVSQINDENIDQVQAETFEGTVEQALSKIVGYLDISNGLSTEQKAAISNGFVENGEYIKNQEERLAKQEEVSQNINEWVEKVSLWSEQATQSFQAIQNDIKTPVETAATALIAIQQSMNNVQESVSKIAEKLGTEIENAKSGNGQINSEAESAWEWFLDESNGNNIKKVRDKLSELKGYEGQDLVDKAKEIEAFNTGWDDLLDAMENMGMISDDDISNLTPDNIKAMMKAAGIEDGVLSSNGNSMLTSASNITPINDGSVQLAKSDPKDMALFAKTGGPFDTLFNGIFSKINEVSNILPKALDYIMPFDKFINDVSNNKDTSNNGNIKIETVKIELNGKLELENNGVNIDIMNEIKNNPTLLRTLSQLISESIEKNINGGKSTYTGGITTPRFKDTSF